MKEKREGLGLSLREASKLSGVSHTHIRGYRRRQKCSVFEMVMKFLSAYGGSYRGVPAGDGIFVAPWRTGRSGGGKACDKNFSYSIH